MCTTQTYKNYLQRYSSLKATSLFSGGGIGEIKLDSLGIDVNVANEIDSKRARFYQDIFPKTKMLDGDIKDLNIKNKLIKLSQNNNLLIATPPCQGFSTIVAKTKTDDFDKDERNFLIYDTFDVIDQCDFDYILIENVPRFLKMLHPYKSDFLTIKVFIDIKYKEKYKIQYDIFDAKDYNVPQTRKRSIIRLCKKGYEWLNPNILNEITLKEAIGHLPPLESGEKSKIQYHYSKIHNEREVEAMKHTSAGKSAFQNEVYYPKRSDGKKISGFHNTYKRLNWDEPCKTRTTNNGSIGSHNNVHPGRDLGGGIYSDARVLSLLELMIVTSIDCKWKPPSWATDSLIRKIIGEGIPPNMLRAILEPIAFSRK